MKLTQMMAATGLAAFLLFAGGAGVASLGTQPAFAQAQPDTKKPASRPTTKARRDRRAAQRAATRSKRAACTAEARARGVSMLRRQSYIRSCMRKG